MNKTDLRILIVEDNFIISADIKRILMNNGYAVVGTEIKGEGVMNKVIEQKPNVIFMDIGLRGKMSGIDAAMKVKEKYHDQIHILFVTGNSDRLKSDERIPIIDPIGLLIKPIYDVKIIDKLESLFPC